MQTYQVVNFSDDPKSQNNWHFKESPDWPWITAIVIGTLVFLYGFWGIWLTERRRLVKRVALHRMPLPIRYLTPAFSASAHRISPRDSRRSGYRDLF